MEMETEIKDKKADSARNQRRHRAAHKLKDLTKEEWRNEEKTIIPDYQRIWAVNQGGDADENEEKTDSFRTNKINGRASDAKKYVFTGFFFTARHGRTSMDE